MDGSHAGLPEPRSPRARLDTTGGHGAPAPARREWLPVLALILLCSTPGTGVVTADTQDAAAGSDPQPAVREGYPDLPPPGRVPEVFAPGLVSTAADEGGAVIHPGGAEIYFWVVRAGDHEGHSTIHVTRWKGGSWTAPEVAPFSGVHSDGYIAMHPDGSRLFFQSDRPIDGDESTFRYNIWYVDRVGDGWSEARSAGRPVNGAGHTGGASVTRDGTLYFTIMDIETGAAQIYRSPCVDGAYQEPELLPPTVNILPQTTDSYVAPDGSYLILTAFGDEGPGGQPGTVYVSFRDGEGRWETARELGPAVNSEDQFGSVTISPDGRFLFFPRYNRPAGTGLDIYWADAAVVDAPGR